MTGDGEPCFSIHDRVSDNALGFYKSREEAEADLAWLAAENPGVEDVLVLIDWNALPKGEANHE